jgi:CPA2 family monovalent cation:H+ antiporter-2
LSIPEMTGHPLDVLTDLALILCVAAVTTVVFQRIRQPVVLGYLVAGVIVGPHLPVPLFADGALAHQLSELGVILLMFSLGLEFSLRKVAKVGPTSGIIAVIECSLMMWLGYLTAGLIGWTGQDRVFGAVMVAMSSTTIVVKAFSDHGIKGNLVEIVFGILIVEDLIAILTLAVLTAVASGAGLSAGALAITVGKLAAFLAGMLVVGMLIVPRLMRFVARLGRDETTTVASVGIAFAFALLARKLGYSVALGAFVAGALVAESGESEKVHHLIEPVRDIFAAIFFVSVGMLIDPQVLVEHWRAVLALTLVVVVGKVVSVSLGAFIAGNGVRTSVQAGMSLAQIGEFSFIIAGVGLSLGAVGKFLYPVAVAVSALTTLATPWLIRAAGPVASSIDGRLPRAFQTLSSLYGSWVQDLRASPAHPTAWSRVRRAVSLLLVDVGLIAAIAIGASLSAPRLVRFMSDAFPPRVAQGLVALGAVVLGLPFLLGAVRVARVLGLNLSRLALPSREGLDLAAAPRRALLVTLQVAILILVGMPLVAITQPFFPRFPGMVVLLVGTMALVIPLWRTATDLHGHVRAGAQVILEALSAQSAQPQQPPTPTPDVHGLLPGIGDPAAFVVRSGAPAIGKTLKEMNLRGLTGATVIAIERKPDRVVLPTADEVLHAGDVLVLAGTHEAVESAMRLLEPLPAAPAGSFPPA